MIQKRETIRAIGFKPSNVAKNTLNVDERISRCASLPKEQGSSDNLLMKAFPQTYQNLAFTPAAAREPIFMVVHSGGCGGGLSRAAAAALCHCLEHHAAG